MLLVCSKSNVFLFVSFCLTAILTKPDLIDRGTEKDVLDIVRNKIIPLNMGYIEKCRGQKQINDGVTINDAIEEERDFFENHDEFR